MLPFSKSQFFDIFLEFNTSIWPLQLLAYLLALTVLAALFRRSGGIIVALTLALMWLAAAAYHVLFFAKINTAAYLFGAMFAVQAALFLAYYSRQRFVLNWSGNFGIAGIALVAYASVAYPLLGLFAGHRLVELPSFGVTPCPATLFTFGILLLIPRPLPFWLVTIPGIWSLIGGSAAVLLDVPQDWPLLFSGALTIPFLLRRSTST